MENTNTFTLDGKEYNTENLSDKAKYLVFNLNELQQARATAERKVAQCSAAEQVFVEELKKELAEEKSEEVEEETGA